jgi:fatty-acyl-CoA synthase
MFHTAGCVIATLGPLWIGGTVVLVERFRPAPVLDALRREHVSALFYVPAILGALLECQRSEPTPAPTLKVIMGGASHVPATMIEDAEEVFGASVINLFGQTELAPVLSATRPSDSRRDQLTTVGRPLPRVECKIVDPTSGATVAIGQPGEICARGYQQFLEYLHDPDATARAVDSEGFVHTGDLGTLDERGYLTVTGRLKELIIRGGENISPAEIEMILVGHDAILDVAVVGVPDDRWGEIVAAVIRVHAEAPQLDRAEVADFVAARLAPFKVPARWFVTDSLPTTPTGKVRKFELRDSIIRGQLREL